MSFLGFVFAVCWAFTGVVAFRVKPKVLVVHAGLLVACLTAVRPWWVVGFLAAAAGAGAASGGLAWLLHLALERMPAPRLPLTGGRRLQAQVRRLSVGELEDGFGQAWGDFAYQRGLVLAACDEPNPAHDPGNPGRLTATYTAPTMQQGQYLLVMVDASPHNGRYGLYGEITTDPDPIAAQAASFGVTRDRYLATRRAT